MPERTVKIPEEAIETAAEVLWNEREYRDPSRIFDSVDPERLTREPHLWAEMVDRDEYKGDQRDYRADARAVLVAVSDALTAPLQRELEEMKASRDGWLANYQAERAHADRLQLRLDAALGALGEIAGVWGEPDQLDWNARAMRRAAREVLATLHAPDGTEGGGS